MGCGWLGLPLATELISRGFVVNGSTTSPAKLGDLEACGIKPFIFKADPIEGLLAPEIDNFLKADAVIINLPPRIRKYGAAYGIALIGQLTQAMAKYPGKVIYTSTTAIYPFINQEQNEDSIDLDVLSEKNAYARIEKTVMNTFHDRTTILRLAGLFGYDRNPLKYFEKSGKQQLHNIPVNYLHRNDAINAIITIIQHDSWGEIYNVVSPIHPDKEKLYAHYAKYSAYNMPEFSNEKKENYKIINGEKLMGKLGFNYEFNHPRDFKF